MRRWLLSLLTSILRNLFLALVRWPETFLFRQTSRPVYTPGKRYNQPDSLFISPPRQHTPRALPVSRTGEQARRPPTMVFFPRRMAFFASLSMLMSLLLCGCSPFDLATTGGMALGEAMMEERGVVTSARDYSLRLNVNDAIFKHSMKLYENISLLVNRGEVVLVGRVPDEVSRLEVENIVSRAGATAVHNALSVGEDLSWGTVIKDHIIANQLALSLITDEDVAAVNFQHAVKDRVVYIAGDARRKSELHRVTYIASHLPDVRQVVTYVHILPARVPEIGQSGEG